MKLSTSIVLCCTLATFTTGVPVEERDIVMITKTDIVMTTIDVTTTIWVDGSSSAPTSTPEVAPEPSAAAAPEPSHQKHIHPRPSVQSVSAPAPVPTVAPHPHGSAGKKPKKHKKPAPVTTPAPAPTPTSAPAPASSPSTSGSSGGLAAPGTSYVGDLTYYADGLGACGWTNGYNDHIVAVSHIVYDAYAVGSNPNDNPLCGRMVNINYGGKTFPAKVVDRCTGCAVGDLDLSEGFFSLVTNGDIAAGRIPGVHWTWM